MKIYIDVISNNFHEFLARPICENSRILCCIAKQSLLDSNLITYIQKLGYEVIVIDKKTKDCKNVK